MKDAWPSGLECLHFFNQIQANNAILVADQRQPAEAEFLI
jgi:hypothetical protein